MKNEFAYLLYGENFTGAEKYGAGGKQLTSYFRELKLTRKISQFWSFSRNCFKFAK